MKHLNSETLKNITDTMPMQPIMKRNEPKVGILGKAHRFIAGDPNRALIRAARVAQRSRTVERITSRSTRNEMLTKSTAKSRKGIPLRRPLKR